MWLPGTAAAMPAIIAARVLDQGAHRGGGSPTKQVRAGVAVPAVHDRAGIDRHDLAVPDRPLARDAVDDLLVDRDAHGGRERPARLMPG